MSETTPNSKGPAKVQLTPEQLASFGQTSTPEATAFKEPRLVPADQVEPEDIGKLAIEYRDGRPVVVVSDGKYVPSELPVVNSSGTTYTARFAWVNGVAQLHTPDPAPPPPCRRLRRRVSRSESVETASPSARSTGPTSTRCTQERY
ncbi:hypothetical protein [Streptomyces sp. NPDC102283]|uniref:hypothetical protein n=1 Tax=Streptomyces sp. NPDC102283 TaxID=3366155 RepID=UPI0038039A46